MSKGKKKRLGIQIEKPTRWGSVKRHSEKVIRGGIKGGGVGVGGGFVASQLFAVDQTTALVVGGITGTILGAADAAEDAHDLECAIANGAEELVEEFGEALEEVGDAIKDAGQLDARELVQAIREEIAGTPERKKKSKSKKDDEDEDDEKPRKGDRKGDRESARR